MEWNPLRAQKRARVIQNPNPWICLLQVSFPRRYPASKKRGIIPIKPSSPQDWYTKNEKAIARSMTFI
jgi:hypothetical protein